MIDSLNKCRFRFCGIIAFLFLYFSPVSFCLGQELTLGKQLEGLKPKPRIAYLKYLIEEEGGDSRIYFHLGLAFQELANSDSALYYYGMAVAEDSTLFKAFANMGIIYDDMGNLIKSSENYRKAIEIKPNAVLPNSHIAYLYYRMGNYSRAIKYLSKALRNHPGHPQPHFYLAIFFWDSAMYREAIKEWEEVINLAPGDYLAESAKESIAMVKRVIQSSSIPKADRAR